VYSTNVEEESNRIFVFLNGYIDEIKNVKKDYPNGKVVEIKRDGRVVGLVYYL
jgi:hypothetical protein